MRVGDPIDQFVGVKGREAEAFKVAGLETVKKVLDWLPKRYEDRRMFDAFPAMAGAPAVCLRGLVVDTQRKGFGGRGFYEAVVEDGGGGGLSRVVCRWFHMPFLHKVLAV